MTVGKTKTARDLGLRSVGLGISQWCRGIKAAIAAGDARANRCIQIVGGRTQETAVIG